MKGLFSKIMGKINELPMPGSPQTQSKTPASTPSSQTQTTSKDVKQKDNNENKKDSQIVIVNERQIENKVEGHYYKKHIEDIKKLKVSEPIIYQRQKMKVNFDIDILDYLFNDMTEIFKSKSNIVEENKNELLKQINETYDLVNVLSDINKNSDELLNKYTKEKKIMENVGFLEIYIKTLSQEVDDLLNDITKFEQVMKNDNKNQ